MNSKALYVTGAAFALTLISQTQSAFARDTETAALYYKCEEGLNNLNLKTAAPKSGSDWFRLNDSTPPVLVNAQASGNSPQLTIYDGHDEFEVPLDKYLEVGDHELALKLPDGTVVGASFTVLGVTGGRPRILSKPGIGIGRINGQVADGTKMIALKGRSDFRTESAPLGLLVSEQFSSMSDTFCKKAKSIAANSKANKNSRRDDVAALLDDYDDALKSCEGVKLKIPGGKSLLVDKVATALLSCQSEAEELLDPSHTSSKSVVPVSGQEVR